jgi:hypothetical protein
MNDALTPAYSKWFSMIRRCYDSSHPAYVRYHGKGVTVSREWGDQESGYATFLADMGEPPEGMTLMRKDATQGYSKDNCKWATWKEQADNRTHGSKTTPDSLRQKALKAGLPYAVVHQRIKKYGWTEAEALDTPKGKQGRVSLMEQLEMEDAKNL